MAKVSKAEAQYEPTSKDPKTVCGGCEHFQGPSSCERVTGVVNRKGWCRLWSALKASLKSMAIGRMA